MPLGWLWAIAASAAGGATTTTATAGAPAEDPAPVGEIVGVVFGPDGAPLGGVTVAAGVVHTETDPGGAFRLAVPAGVGELTVTYGGRSSRVTGVAVVDARTTEVLVTIRADGTLSATLESPSAADVVAASDVPTGPPGELAGTLTDRDTGEPIAGVRVFARGSPTDAVTDADGRFRMRLPSGAWDLSAIRAGYGTATLDVDVAADTVTTVTVTLEKAGLVLDDLRVSAPRIAGNAASLLDERRDASTVSDVLGAEQMARSGDSDAASALRRVTGLTVIGGKYVYVRGLGDRYAATRLDGSSLPSPEPEKRVVPLDLFPAALLDSVVIEKSFSPDRPAEFGGGMVEIRTRSIPKEPTLSVSLSGGYVAGATFQEALDGDHGPTDVLGFGTGYRALPDEVQAASDDEPLKAGGIFSDGGYDPDELEQFGEAIANRWALSPRGLPPDFGVTLTAGASADLGPVDVGGLVGLVFSNGWDLEQGTQTLYSAGEGGLVAKRITDFVEAKNRIRVGGALALGGEWQDGELGSTTLVMRNSAASALSYDADDPTGSSDTHNTRLDWLEQQLVFEQLSFAQDFGPAELEVRYAAALASGREPDRRDVTWLDTEAGLVLSQRGSWSEILYTALDDTSHDLGVDVTVPVSLSEREGRLKAGGGAVLRHRDSTTRRFGYTFHGSEGIDLSAPIEQVIAPANIGADAPGDPGYLELEENTSSSDDYTARQRLVSAYAMADLPVLPRLGALVGARVESSSQQVDTFELFNTDGEPVRAELTTTDVLPAVIGTLAIGRAPNADALLLRLGYGRTLSRPEFRELTEVAYYDYRSGRLLYGNPDLQRATIDNVDARIEWYGSTTRTRGESLSAGVFFKRFVDPIESVVAVSAVSGSVGTFANAASAANAGVEVDVRNNLVSCLWLTANGSLVYSRVDLSDTGGNQTSTERPLQGQSPWVVNAQLSWEDPDRRRSVALLYNVFGPRIVDVGTSGIPDTYELPVHRVDLVASQGFGPHWSARVKGANLLGAAERERTGELVSERVDGSWSAALSLTWTP